MEHSVFFAIIGTAIIHWIFYVIFSFVAHAAGQAVRETYKNRTNKNMVPYRTVTHIIEEWKFLNECCMNDLRGIFSTKTTGILSVIIVVDTGFLTYGNSLITYMLIASILYGIFHEPVTKKVN